MTHKSYETKNVNYIWFMGKKEYYNSKTNLLKYKCKDISKLSRKVDHPHLNITCL